MLLVDQISMGLAALNVLLKLFVGALLSGLTLGNLRFVFEYTLVAVLTASLLETTLVLMI